MLTVGARSSTNAPDVKLYRDSTAGARLGSCVCVCESPYLVLALTPTRSKNPLDVVEDDLGLVGLGEHRAILA